MFLLYCFSLAFDPTDTLIPKGQKFSEKSILAYEWSILPALFDRAHLANANGEQRRGWLQERD